MELIDLKLKPVKSKKSQKTTVICPDGSTYTIEMPMEQGGDYANFPGNSVEVTIVSMLDKQRITSWNVAEAVE